MTKGDWPRGSVKSGDLYVAPPTARPPYVPISYDETTASMTIILIALYLCCLLVCCCCFVLSLSCLEVPSQVRSQELCHIVAQVRSWVGKGLAAAPADNAHLFYNKLFESNEIYPRLF